MNRTVVREEENYGEAMSSGRGKRKRRNINADKVGIDHENKINYDEIGSAWVNGPITLKIETTPGGEELYTGDIAEGEKKRVYWGITKVER